MAMWRIEGQSAGRSVLRRKCPQIWLLAVIWNSLPKYLGIQPEDPVASGDWKVPVLDPDPAHDETAAQRAAKPILHAEICPATVCAFAKRAQSNECETKRI